MNVSAIAKNESNGNAAREQQLLRYTKNCVKPAYEYFQQKFDDTTDELKDPVLVFKAACYFLHGG